jgi:DNA-directed RNA polymerase III subunit RPC6
MATYDTTVCLGQALEKNNKIKTVSSVREPRKKLYMLFGTEPNTAITGGTWYSDADFDAEFVNIVYKTCFEYLTQRVCL